MVLNNAIRQKQSSVYMKHLRTRRQLPAYQLFDSLIWPTICRNQVTVLAGATGCGKTTQIPQLILDAEMASNNGLCKIICTQPRRMAAVSVATRVAQERAEQLSGGYGMVSSIGYHVKLDSKPPRETWVGCEKA